MRNIISHIVFHSLTHGLEANAPIHSQYLLSIHDKQILVAVIIMTVIITTTTIVCIVVMVVMVCTTMVTTIITKIIMTLISQFKCGGFL